MSAEFQGKTTLVDQLMKQSGMGLKVTERMMDSKDLEQERGITILSKATRISWRLFLAFGKALG